LQLKIDLHVHTEYSNDSIITLEKMIFYAKQRRLDGVAVTDHDTLDGALRMKKQTDFPIVPGMEISSQDGHVLALNVQEPVPKGLGAAETVDRVHEAGGIAIACHPLTFFKGSLRSHVNSRFDAIEVINSSAFPFRHSLNNSEQMASRLGLPRVGGSDAHYGPEIGCAYTLINAEPKSDEIVKAIRQGLCQPFGGAMPFALRLKREIGLSGKKLTSFVIR
jgi:predicted metal-dependent phosphoesterase TrpH